MRLGLSSAQLAQMRAQAASLMPDTCSIQSVVVTSDGEGGQVETWSTVATVACRLDIMPARTRTEMEAAREARTTFYRLTVPYDTALTVESQVVHEGVAYQVGEVHPRRSWEVVLRATLVRVD